MNIAILGAGFTGLSAALSILQKDHKVTIFEKEADIGGLAAGFKLPGWDWSLEKAYHHWFTNDNSVLNLAAKINSPVVIKRPQTNVYINGHILPFDSPSNLLNFPYLSMSDKLRAGAVLAYLKLTNNYRQFEGKKALPWIKTWMGQEMTNLIWEPLFRGKFGDYKDQIALTWFWARIKKRTPVLAYPEGGFKVFVQRLADEIKSLGGKIHLDTEVTKIIPSNKTVILNVVKNPKQEDSIIQFDKVLVTLPSPIFTKISQDLPAEYVKKITSIPHLHAQNLILVLSKPFMKQVYWLNIAQKDWPFLVLAEHTNFMDPKHYNNQHILYIGNYLPQYHPYLKMNESQLLKEFDPFLKKINSSYELSLITSFLFIGPFAQPVVGVDYPNLIPTYKTPLSNIYLANLDMVYPWDRGTNYAVQMGQAVAKLIDSDES